MSLDADQTYWEACHPARKPRKWQIKPEDALQILCIKLLRARRIPFVIAQPERLNAPVQRRDWLKKLGILGNSGHVELICFLPSRVLCIELKAAKGVVSAEQEAWHKRLPEPVHVVRSIGEFEALIGGI